MLSLFSLFYQLLREGSVLPSKIVELSMSPFSSVSFCFVYFETLLLVSREGNGNPLQYFCWEIPRTEEPGGLQSMGSQKANMTEQLSDNISQTFSFSFQCIS